MGYYPIMLELKGRLCVVIGGGAVAERKVMGLLEAEARVKVISPVLSEELERLAEAGVITAVRREYREQDVEGAALLFTVSSNEAANRQASLEARQRHVLVCRADVYEDGDFITPSVVRRGHLLLAVTASGASPALAREVASELSDRYGEPYAGFTAWLKRLREASYGMEPKLRSKVLHEALLVPEEEWRKDIEQTALLARLKQLEQRCIAIDGGSK